MFCGRHRFRLRQAFGVIVRAIELTQLGLVQCRLPICHVVLVRRVGLRRTEGPARSLAPDRWIWSRCHAETLRPLRARVKEGEAVSSA